MEAGWFLFAAVCLGVLHKGHDEKEDWARGIIWVALLLSIVVCVGIAIGLIVKMLVQA